MLKTLRALAGVGAGRPLSEVLVRFHEAGIPAGKIYDVCDIAEDPHYRADEMLLEVGGATE